MKKSSVNALFAYETKRRNTIISYICIITLLIILTFSFILIFINKNKTKYVSYNESSKVDYKVYLKNNDFFDYNYLPSNNQYITSLIDYITASFNYDLTLEEKEVLYKYSYEIEANLIIKEQTSNKVLYSEKEILKDKVNVNESKGNISINENVKIDFNKFNKKATKFISLYGLDNTISTLDIKMYIDVSGNCEDFSKNTEDEGVITLSIPLTKKTINIDTMNNFVNNDTKILLCKEDNIFNTIYIVLSVITSIILIIMSIKLYKYINKTKTKLSVYKKELKKILNNYGTYIQKINNSFSLRGYQVLKVAEFNDLLEIRDTIEQPILMVSNEDNLGTFFIIPSNTKLLYVYGLRVEDINLD